MSPTKQEEYDASRDVFDPKTVYAAITEMQRHQHEFMGYITALEKVAYTAARALEDERAKTQRLEAKLERWEAQAAAHETACTCNRCTEGGVA